MPFGHSWCRKSLSAHKTRLQAFFVQNNYHLFKKLNWIFYVPPSKNTKHLAISWINNISLYYNDDNGIVSNTQFILYDKPKLNRVSG